MEPPLMIDQAKQLVSAMCDAGHVRPEHSQFDGETLPRSNAAERALQAAWLMGYTARKKAEFNHAYMRENNMSDWNDAIELAAQLCEKLQRELRGASEGGALEEHVKHALTTFGVAASHIRELKRPEPKAQQPSVGRIVHVMLKDMYTPGLLLRSAVITRVGPVMVDTPVVPGRVALHVFTAPEDKGRYIEDFEADQSPEGGAWDEKTWRWPSRV
jgi:hypothetical protein